MFKSIILGAFLVMISHLSVAQEVLILNQPVVGSQDHSASLEVYFQPGYIYRPVGSECMRAYIGSILNNYGHLSKKLDGGVYKISDDKIYLKYREEYNTASFQFKLYDAASNVIGSQNSITASTFLGYGDNRIEIPVAGVITSSGYYTLEVINDKNEKWYLRLEY